MRLKFQARILGLRCKHTRMDKHAKNIGASNLKVTGKEDTEKARTEAGNDIEQDPDSVGMDNRDDLGEDDLDEGELARKDNSND
jgi:hypothetical protein